MMASPMNSKAGWHGCSLRSAGIFEADTLVPDPIHRSLIYLYQLCTQHCLEFGKR